MENEHPLHYFKNGLTIGLGLGFAGGFFNDLVEERQAMNADDVLDNIKAAFIKEGPIEGSWINFEKQPLRKFAITSQGYTGGITPHRRRAACHL